MLATSARVSPCRRGPGASRRARETMTCFSVSSYLADTSGRMFLRQACPSGPSTVIVLSATPIFTPAGTATGCLPIRDIFVHLHGQSVAYLSLASERCRYHSSHKYLAAQISLPRFAIADHAAAGADDRNAQAVEHGTQAAGAAIDAVAGLADAANVPNHALAVGAIFQVQSSVWPRARLRALPSPRCSPRA